MRISEEEVRKVAQLARLHLDPEEVEEYRGQLDAILAYIAKLNELDTSAVEPTTHVLAISQPLREDVSAETLPQKEAVRNAPESDGESFIVPRVI